MKLNIYKHNEIIKTYEASTAFLPLGICEDILKAVNIDDLVTTSSDKESQLKLGANILKIVVGNFDSFKELLLQTFDGLTEEELRGVDVGEVAAAITEIVKFSLNKLFNVDTTKKN